MIFSSIVLIASLFPPLDFLLALGGYQLFWQPIVWGVIIPSSFVYLLWNSGKKISKLLDKNKSIKTSAIFTLNINIKLFTIIMGIYIISFLFFRNSTPLTSKMFPLLIGLFTIIVSFIFSTIATTFTIGLIIVKLTQNKLKTLNFKPHQ